MQHSTLVHSHARLSPAFPTPRWRPVFVHGLYAEGRMERSSEPETKRSSGRRAQPREEHAPRDGRAVDRWVVSWKSQESINPAHATWSVFNLFIIDLDISSF